MAVIKIHPDDVVFNRLMKQAAKALRTNNQGLLKKVKAEFATGSISLFYNKETDIIRVLKKDAPPIDFAVSKFE